MSYCQQSVIHIVKSQVVYDRFIMSYCQQSVIHIVKSLRF